MARGRVRRAVGRFWHVSLMIRGYEKGGWSTMYTYRMMKACTCVRRKKMKPAGGADGYNPYLAHMEQDGNGVQGDEPGPNSPFAGMKRRQTTAKQAEKVEDLDENPFNGTQGTMHGRAHRSGVRAAQSGAERPVGSTINGILSAARHASWSGQSTVNRQSPLPSH